jgi:hypothetical protein
MKGCLELISLRFDLYMRAFIKREHTKINQLARHVSPKCLAIAFHFLQYNRQAEGYISDNRKCDP